MNICIFNSFYPLIKGGAEYQARLLADYLKNNHSVFFISYGHSNNSIEYIDGFKVYKLRLFPILDKVSLYYYSNFYIKQILNIEQPDIIYQRVLNSYSLHLSNYIDITEKCKLFIHIADNYSLSFSKSLRSKIRYFMFNQIRKVKIKTNRIFFIIQSKSQKAQLAYLNIKKATYMNNMHEEPNNKNEKDSFKLQKNIAWIGSAREIKRLELYLDIAEQFVMSENIIFHIFGRIHSREKYGKMLLKRINAMKNIVFHGEVSNDTINSFLEQKAFLLINTSKSEGFSNTFIQAWLRSVPVLSLNSNPNYLFDNYQLGCFCNDNMEKLVAYLYSIINDNKVYAITSKKCAEFAFSNFLIKDIGVKFENLFKYES